MTDYSYWILFLSAAFIINISPGPDILYILSQTMSNGKKAGFASSLGVCCGAYFHVILIACGLSALLSASVTVFMIIKYAGAAYLFYLGIKSFISTSDPVAGGDIVKKRITVFYAFRRGVLVDILNPKVAFFFIAFIPQFIRPGHGSFMSQTFILGSVIILMAIPVEWTIVLLADRCINLVNNRPSLSSLIDKIAGTILIALGFNLILSKVKD